MRILCLIGVIAGSLVFINPFRTVSLHAPRNLKIDVLRDRFTLDWDDVGGAALYRVFIDGEPESSEFTQSRATGMLKQAGLHHFAVAAVDSDGKAGAMSRPIKGIRFSRPWGIAVLPDGRRIVRDAHLPGHAIFDSQGRALQIASAGSLSLTGSYDVAVDRSGRVLTARWGDASPLGTGFVIQNPRFKILSEHYFETSYPNELRQPMGIGADSAGRIYVADTMNNRVTTYTKGGQFTGTIGGGELRLPMKVAFDSKDRLYVADSGNNRIAVYERADGEFKLTRSITGMKEPVYVAVDGDFRVFVSANRQAGVHMFGPDGKELWKYEGDAIAHLSGPRGLALDGKGNLLIVDEASLRVLTVRIPRPSFLYHSTRRAARSGRVALSVSRQVGGPLIFGGQGLSAASKSEGSPCGDGHQVGPQRWANPGEAKGPGHRPGDVPLRTIDPPKRSANHVH